MSNLNFGTDIRIENLMCVVDERDALLKELSYD